MPLTIEDGTTLSCLRTYTGRYTSKGGILSLSSAYPLSVVLLSVCSGSCHGSAIALYSASCSLSIQLDRQDGQRGQPFWLFHSPCTFRESRSFSSRRYTLLSAQPVITGQRDCKIRASQRASWRLPRTATALASCYTR